MTLEEYKKNPYAWPGGYQLNAIMDDGEIMCHECVCENEEVHEGGEKDGWRVEGFEVYWEGPHDTCCHCNKLLESEYGDPDEEDSDE